MNLQSIDAPTHASPALDSAGAILRRIRFVALWLTTGCAMVGTTVVFFYEPGVLREGVAGEMEGDPVTTGTALLMAAMIGVPLIVAAATLFLPARASDIANLIVGVPFLAFGLFAVVSHLAEGAWPAHVTLVALAAAITSLIVGLSIAELRQGPSRDQAQ